MERWIAIAFGAVVALAGVFWLLETVISWLFRLTGKAATVTLAALSSGGVSLLAQDITQDPEIRAAAGRGGSGLFATAMRGLATGGVSLFSDPPRSMGIHDDEKTAETT
jgi:hypothetical protein